jgi:4-phospho-D-threonate 3-dehydrogenase / 4-phospho-D-erythronate 3-dehydrogenase
MKPRIAITMGDFNGIGPEVTLQSIITPEIHKICTPLLVGSIDVYEYYAKRLGIKINLIELDRSTGRMIPGEISVFHIRKFQNPTLRPGTLSIDAGGYAGEAIEIAASLCLQGFADGMVTAPVSKIALNNAGYKYPGQTEFLAKLCGTSKQTMMLVAGRFRVALATIHMPLKKVPLSITKALLTEKLNIVRESCKKDFGIRKPRIAMLSLNPHAGEDGLLGDEENKILIPVIKTANRKKLYVDGPFPSDGFFGTHSHTDYDAILAMYHDQGLIPLKMAGFSTGVNFTAGLPIVRTSPDHGTAFEIAGKGIADPSSMTEAIRLAVEIIKNRRGR